MAYHATWETLHVNNGPTRRFTVQRHYSRSSSSRTTPPPPEKHHAPLQKWFISHSILGVILAIVATALIVTISNGQIVNQWKVRPSVILAILSSLMAAILSYLLSNGIAITWWHAVGRGTTVEHLQQMTNKGILFQPHRWSVKLFVGSTFTSVVLGTLVISIAAFASAPMVFNSRSIPRYASEDSRQGGRICTAPASGISTTFDPTAAAVQGYRNDTIKNTGPDSSYYCNGTYHGTIQTPGISVECSTSTHEMGLYSAAATKQSPFLLAFNLAQDTGGHPLINFTSQYSSSVDLSCYSRIITDTCWVYAATTKSYSSIAYVNGVKSMETRGTATEIFYIYFNLVNGTQGYHWTWRSPTTALLIAI
ncbi:hypothetical protein B0J14DRAFT_665104 [Halenospora varia]|nr:hypothetical protein B0J14DRAFT_665104 [Halenospora varia]